MSLTIQLKITLNNNETRHISILKSTNLSNLQSTVISLFSLSPRHTNASSIKFAYDDDDNDRISIGSSEELADAFQLAKGSFLQLHASAENVVFAAKNEEKLEIANAVANNDDGVGDDSESENVENSNESPLVQFFKDLGQKLQSEGASVAAHVKKVVDEMLRSGVVSHDEMLEVYAALAASPKELQDLVGKMVAILCEQYETIAALPDPTLSRARHAALCDRCRQSIVGVRYKCSACADYDLCSACFRLNITDKQHDESHLFLTIVAPLRGSPAVFRNLRPRRWPPVSVPAPVPVPAPIAVPPPMPSHFHAPLYHQTPVYAPQPPQHNGYGPAPRYQQQPAHPLFARFVCDETIPDGTKMKPGEQFTKIWLVENTGHGPWSVGCQAVSVGGDVLSDFDASESLPVVSSGQQISIAVDMRAPEEPGSYTSFWRLASANGERFGQRLWTTIIVEEEEEVLVEEEEEVVEEEKAQEEVVEEQEQEAEEELAEAAEEFEAAAVEEIERQIVAEPEPEDEVEAVREAEAELPEPEQIDNSLLNVIERSFEHIEQIVAPIVAPIVDAIAESAAPAVVEEPVAPAAEVVAEEEAALWRSQRSQLKAMGFGQNDAHLQQLLKKHNGEVLKVVQELLEDE